LSTITTTWENSEYDTITELKFAPASTDQIRLSFHLDAILKVREIEVTEFTQNDKGAWVQTDKTTTKVPVTGTDKETLSFSLEDPLALAAFLRFMSKGLNKIVNQLRVVPPPAPRVNQRVMQIQRKTISGPHLTCAASLAHEYSDDGQTLSRAQYRHQLSESKTGAPVTQLDTEDHATFFSRESYLIRVDVAPEKVLFETSPALKLYFLDIP